MAVLKYKDPITGEVKKVFAPVNEGYRKQETYNKKEVYNKTETYNKEEIQSLINTAISNAITTAIGGSY